MFFYFIPDIPDAKQVDRELLKRLGLDSVLRDCIRTDADLAELRQSTTPMPGSGPGGHGGSIMAPMPIDGWMPDRFGYHPNSQTWVELGGYWMGFDNEQKPNEATLRRKTPLIDGNPVELGDNTHWIAPLIRYPITGEHYLPANLGVDASGEVVQGVATDYVADWEMAGELFQVSVGLREMTLSEEFHYGVRCLGINYRLGPHECTALGLINSSNLALVTGAAFDLERVKEYVKETSASNGEPVPIDETPEPEKKNGRSESSGETLNTTGGQRATEGYRDTVHLTETCGSSREVSVEVTL